jgi:hypothetical protein
MAPVGGPGEVPRSALARAGPRAVEQVARLGLTGVDRPCAAQGEHALDLPGAVACAAALRARHAAVRPGTGYVGLLTADYRERRAQDPEYLERRRANNRRYRERKRARIPDAPPEATAVSGRGLDCVAPPPDPVESPCEEGSPQ